MPDLSSLVTKLACLTCGKEFHPPEHEIRFQWGHVPSRYRVGDAVRWLTQATGEIVPPFRSVHEHWNYGEPAYRDVLAFEIDPHEPEFRCTHCGQHYAHAAAEIRNGSFVGGIVFATRDDVLARFGASPDDFEVATRAPDGTWTARTDWSNPVITPLDR
jgi:DNA-directed RNA polymerase subunit RPC12/RpoP